MSHLVLGTAIADQEFEGLRALLYREAGITLSEQKKPMVCGRLGKRLTKLGLSNYGAYLRRIESGQDPAELQTAIDLLTTNETYFFREPKHFEWLRARMKAAPAGRAFRVWSAACSSGEEPYTIAMVAAEALGDRPWEVYASDISTRVLDTARSGLYPLERAEHIPKALLTKYCLRGNGKYEGSFLIAKSLRQRVQFRHMNLQRPLPELPFFDVIFLRNVMIYFDAETKKALVERLAERLLPDGRLVIGHSESLNGLTDAVEQEIPTVYARTRVAPR